MIRLTAIIAILTTLVSACAFDDDSQYEIKTRAAYFFCPAASGTGMQVVRWDSDGITPSWNTNFGIPDRDLSDFQGLQNHLWLSSGRAGTLMEIDIVKGRVLRRFNGLPIAPDVFAIGEKHALIADTAARAIAFIDLRDGEAPFIETGIHATRCLHNHGRFYLAAGGDTIIIYDEQALHPRATLSVGTTIDDIMFDNNYNLRIFSHDTTRYYLAILNANGDYISAPNYAVNHHKVRFSPYFYPKFGTEITKDIQLTGTQLATTTLEPLLDSIQNFEADFFAGIIYCTWHDTLLRYDFATDSIIDRRPFPHQMRRAFFQYGAE